MDHSDFHFESLVNQFQQLFDHFCMLLYIRILWIYNYYNQFFMYHFNINHLISHMLLPLHNECLGIKTFLLKCVRPFYVPFRKILMPNKSFSCTQNLLC